jgi:succinate-acetate transporter protein
LDLPKVSGRPDRGERNKFGISLGQSRAVTPVAGYELMMCAGLALYVMSHLVFADMFGRDVLPVGKPWLR